MATFQFLMYQLRLFHSGSRCIGGLNAGDEMRVLRITGFSEMHFVPIPRETSFSPKMSLWIIRRAYRQMSRRKSVFVSQAQMPFFPNRVLNPDLSQELYLRQAREQSRGIFLLAHRQELRAISPDLVQKSFWLFFLECSS